MAVTIANSLFKPVDFWGSQAFRLITLTDSAAAYPTGGYVLTPGTVVNLNTILYAFVVGNPSGYVINYNQVTNALIVYQQSAATSALTQVPAGTDLSAFTFLIVVMGY